MLPDGMSRNKKGSPTAKLFKSLKNMHDFSTCGFYHLFSFTGDPCNLWQSLFSMSKHYSIIGGQCIGYKVIEKNGRLQRYGVY
jgi:hypothetical protein